MTDKELWSTLIIEATRKLDDIKYPSSRSGDAISYVDAVVSHYKKKFPDPKPEESDPQEEV